MCICVCVPPGCAFVGKKKREKEMDNVVCISNFLTFLVEAQRCTVFTIQPVFMMPHLITELLHGSLATQKTEEISAFTAVWTTFYTHKLQGWISRTLCRLTQRKLLYGT